MLRSPRRLFGMDVLGGERLTQDLLQVNEMFALMSITPNPNNLLRVVLTKQISRTK